jgi:hypothetical protein
MPYLSKTTRHFELEHLHVFSRHFQLVLSECVETAKSDIRISNVMLASREELQVVSSLKDGTITRRDVQTVGVGLQQSER